MKKIVCEMCGSNEFVKDGDFMVCQSCGTKFTIEDARKMMVEVEGTVKVKIVDDEAIERYKQQAEKAFSDESWLDAVKYYTKFLEAADGDYEAHFRCLLAKSQCWGNAFNSLPYIGDSINLTLSKLYQYALDLKADSFIDDDARINKINNALSLIESSIWWVFNRDKGIYLEKENTSRLSAGEESYFEIMERLEECFQYYRTFYAAVRDVLKVLPDVVYEREKVVKWGSNLLSWYDHKYFYEELDETYYEYRDKVFYLNPARQTVAKDFKKTTIEYEKHIAEVRNYLEMAKIESYWKDHSEEKLKYERDISKIEAEIQTHEDRIRELSRLKGTEITLINDRIALLVKDKNALGFFKVKERKAIQKEIDDGKSKRDTVEIKMEEEITSIKKIIELFTKRLPVN